MASCSSDPPPSVPVPRRPDAALLQPCELPAAALPATLPYRLLLDLWQTAERLLAQCAAGKDRLIDFEKDRAPVPDPDPPAKGK
jgi:hypothetical protein